MTYFAQAADLGWTSAIVSGDGTTTRQLFYARYINHLVAFPSLALALGLLSGISWTTIVLNIVIAWFWVLAYVAATYTGSSYRWGFFAFGTFAYVILALSTLNESREAAGAVGVGRDYGVLAGWVNMLWVLYPVAFGLSDCGGVIGVTGGCVFFGVLDVLLLPVVSVGFLVLSRYWDCGMLQLEGGACCEAEVALCEGWCIR